MISALWLCLSLAAAAPADRRPHPPEADPRDLADRVGIGTLEQLASLGPDPDHRGHERFVASFTLTEGARGPAGPVRLLWSLPPGERPKPGATGAVYARLDPAPPRGAPGERLTAFDADVTAARARAANPWGWPPHGATPLARLTHARDPMPAGLALDVVKLDPEDPRDTHVQISLSNPTDAPATVGPLRSTAGHLRWRDSLALALDAHLVTLPPCPDTPRSEDAPAELGPGDTVTVVVDLEELPRVGPPGRRPRVVTIGLGPLAASVRLERGSEGVHREALARVDRGECAF